MTHAFRLDDAPVGAARLALRRLTIGHFRNYADFSLDLSGACVVLYGPNGAGKTNILEAISLLVPGRGLRRARGSELQNVKDGVPWGVYAVLDTPQGEMSIGTGRDSAAVDGDRRVIQIDGRVQKSQQSLAEHVAMAWITPELDRVLVEGASARRKLLDRLAYSFDPAHAGRVARYEKAMRERLRLLREGVRDPAWLSGLEDEMARTGVAIAAARRHLVLQLQGAMVDVTDAFPHAILTPLGQAEEALASSPALIVEDNLRDGLARTRSLDAENGTCSCGPHRSDLGVHHEQRDCPADLCSTGEQKALLIALMLAYVRVLTASRGLAPLLLLDDIAAHLDRARRIALFAALRDLNVQAWLTGTDRDLFDGMGDVQMIGLGDGVA